MLVLILFVFSSKYLLTSSLIEFFLDSTTSLSIEDFTSGTSSMICYAGSFLPSSEWKHMNWGYAALNEDGHSIELKPEDENERFSIQYSHFVATGTKYINAYMC